MKKKVLVVDDEEDLTWSISKNLSRDKDNFEVICVNSGDEALNLLAQVPVDLVVSDIRMPGISGLDLLLEIKKEYPNTRAIIMTAFGSADVQKEATERGSLFYIEKPFEIDDLRGIIQKALSEKKGFDGKVTDFQLSDLIQMNILGRMVAALIVNKDNQQGIIYFSEGNITHAMCGSLKGDEAFYRIMSWEDGKFEFRKGEIPEEESITKGWQSLLLEGMRRKDEVNPESKTQMKEDSRQESLEKVRSSLADFTKIKGVDVVAVVDESGFVRASAANDKKPDAFDLTLLANFYPQAVEFISKTDKETGGGQLRFMTIELQSRTLFMIAIPNRKETLFVVTEPDVNLGAIRLASKKQIPILAELI